MRLERLEIAGFKSFSDRSELAFDRGRDGHCRPQRVRQEQRRRRDHVGARRAKRQEPARREDGRRHLRRQRRAQADRRRRSAPAAQRRDDRAGQRQREWHGNGHANGNGHNGHGEAVAEVLTPAEAVLAEFRPAGRDVELVRRLYRSGESEYLIDGAQCRLRDIHELLMDTGLGAKAYAIIEQGKIGLILSSRPTDRRMLIEEAAGITKYKARRRSAELKLEAAQQNLTRIDDIVFEVDKQRGSLKRQAAKARRHQRLRDELRRWEKVLFARRFRDLSHAIESARARLADARERESAAEARLAQVEGDISRLRIEVAEADSTATAARDRAHTHELEIQRTQQQVELNRQQVTTLGSRIADLDDELASLDARREPQRALIADRRDAAGRAEQERQQAAERLAEHNEQYQIALRDIEGLEGDVETARSEVFAAINAATALRHSIDSAGAARERMQEGLSRLDVEQSDLGVESERLAADRLAAEQGAAGVQRRPRGRPGPNASRSKPVWPRRVPSTRRWLRSCGLASTTWPGCPGRLRSLEELEAARAGFTEAARVLLAQANGRVEQRGAVADYLEVDRRYERAVEALLGDLLQHVVVPTHEHAAAGVQLLREQQAGRCGFVVLGQMPSTPPGPTPHGVVAVADLVRSERP